MVETTNISSKIQDVVMTMPTFSPTEEQFRDPITYIESLVSGPDDIG
jgi:hypothetical protein